MPLEDRPRVEERDNSADILPPPSPLQPSPRLPVEEKYSLITARLRSGDPSAPDDFRVLCIDGALDLFRRHLGPIRTDALVQEALNGAIEEIRRGWIKDPRDLVHLFRNIIDRHRCGNRRDPLASDSPAGATDKARLNLKAEQLAGVLVGFAPLERQALEACYRLGKPTRQVALDLGMTESEVRALKHRLRAALGGKPLAAAAWAGRR